MGISKKIGLKTMRVYESKLSVDVPNFFAGGDDETRTRVQNDKKKTFYENSLVLKFNLYAKT